MHPALETLRDIVYRRDLTLRAIARLTGVAPATSSQLFSGIKTGRLSTVTAIAEGIGLEPCSRCHQLGWTDPEEEHT